MPNTFLKINTGPVTLEVGVEDEYLKISIENTDTHDYSGKIQGGKNQT